VTLAPVKGRVLTSGPMIRAQVANVNMLRLSIFFSEKYS